MQAAPLLSRKDAQRPPLTHQPVLSCLVQPQHRSMADCLLFSTLLRSIRFNRPKNQSAEKLNGKNSSIFAGQQLEKAKSLDNDNGNSISIIEYESSCKDLAHIKQQLLLLKNIFDTELNVGQLLEETEQSLQKEQELPVNPRRILTIEQLTEENDALRRQLLEKDKIIESLRSQLKVQ